MLGPELDPASRQCPICSSFKLRTFRARAFDTEGRTSISVVECESCFFAWQYPVGRSDLESVEYFGSAYADEAKTMSGYFDPNLKLQISKLEMDFLESLPVQGRRLLDVGAGAGIFATMAADLGWQVTAVDPALDLSRVDGIRVRTIAGTLANVPSGEQFDVVTLWDVIEHVSEPVSLVQAAREFVCQGGWIVVETGNYKSADRISSGVDHWIFQLDHRWYFSPDSVAGLLKQAGFTDLTFAKRVLRPKWTGSAEYSGPSMTHLLKSVIRRPWVAVREVKRYRRLHMARNWMLAGLGIFCVAGQRN